VHSNTGNWPLYQMAWDGHAQVHFSWRTWSAWPSMLQMVGCKNMHGSLVIIEMCGIHFAQTFHFPKLLVRMW
jgi:hypothetical protein